jgi:23S rRNA (guanosine2251-2'-O)-methyltransferase
MLIAIENIRSAWNVGSIMRSCDALGITKLLIVGYTPRPVGGNLRLISKTAIGSENTVVWEGFEHAQEVFDSYSKDAGYIHLAIDINENSTAIFDYLATNKTFIQKNSDKIILWFGNEISGISSQTIENCVDCLHLEMCGIKESLNVSSCMCSVGYLFDYVIKKS